MTVTSKPKDKIRTKTGHVEVKDGIVVLESSVWGILRNIWDGLTTTSKPFQAVAVVSVFVTVMLSLALAALSSPSILGSALTVSLLAIILANRKDARDKNLSTVSEIDIEKIQKVNPESGVFGLIRPRLIIEFEDTTEIKSRYVLLPHGLFTDTDYLEAAVQYFESEGIDVGF
jgi:hypothetical protein